MLYPSPDPDFCKKLRSMDQNLELNWDPKQERWSVWFRNPDDGSRHHVCTSVNADGSFRPLDSKTLDIIRLNKFYAENPQALDKVTCGKLEADRKRQEEATHDHMRYIAKDKTLKKMWNDVVETARSVPYERWAEKRAMVGYNGDVAKSINEETGQLETVYYKPHKSFLQKKKPQEKLNENL